MSPCSAVSGLARPHIDGPAHRSMGALPSVDEGHLCWGLGTAGRPAPINSSPTWIYDLSFSWAQKSVGTHVQRRNKKHYFCSCFLIKSVNFFHVPCTLVHGLYISKWQLYPVNCEEILVSMDRSWSPSPSVRNSRCSPVWSQGLIAQLYIEDRFEVTVWGSVTTWNSNFDWLHDIVSCDDLIENLQNVPDYSTFVHSRF